MKTVSEKIPLESDIHRADGKQRTSVYRFDIWLAVLCILTLCTQPLSIPNVIHRYLLSPTVVSYNQGSIAWQSCRDLPEYHCGYLTVPLDWTGKHYPDEFVHLALRKLPAWAPPTERLGVCVSAFRMNSY